MGDKIWEIRNKNYLPETLHHYILNFDVHLLQVFIKYSVNWQSKTSIKGKLLIWKMSLLLTVIDLLTLASNKRVKIKFCYSDSITVYIFCFVIMENFCECYETFWIEFRCFQNVTWNTKGLEIAWNVHSKYFNDFYVTIMVQFLGSACNQNFLIVFYYRKFHFKIGFGLMFSRNSILKFMLRVVTATFPLQRVVSKCYKRSSFILFSSNNSHLNWAKPKWC